MKLTIDLLADDYRVLLAADGEKQLFAHTTINEFDEVHNYFMIGNRKFYRLDDAIEYFNQD